MQTDHHPHLDPQPHPIDREIGVDSEPVISISRLVHVMTGYSRVILFSLACLALTYVTIAVAYYLFSSAGRTSMQSFRLDFEGAGEGRYPNGTKFNVADIINQPILARVHRENQLSDFLALGDFSRSIFILESNPEYEQLAAEYQALLTDPQRTPVDRERLQREFELKRQAISKNEYTIYFNRRLSSYSVPEPLARKVLLDILNAWADFAVNQQHVFAYEVSVLSPDVLAPSGVEQNDLVAAIAVLRAKSSRVVYNVQKIEKLPGATLARTPKDRLSLEEIRIRLDEILRFRLEPLLAEILHSPGMIRERALTVRFLESQLAFDARQLEATQRVADSLRDAILVYEQPARSALSGTSTSGSEESTGSVTPQLSDSFLDRLVTLTGRAADSKYRQALIDDYRKAVIETIPWKQAVAYDTQILQEMQKPSAGTPLSADAVRTQIDEARAEVGTLINKMNELFVIISRNMTPSTQLFSVTSPPVTRTLRAVSPQRLVLFGVLLLLVGLPIIVFGCILHNRMREEEAAEQMTREQTAEG